MRGKRIDDVGEFRADAEHDAHARRLRIFPGAGDLVFELPRRAKRLLDARVRGGSAAGRAELGDRERYGGQRVHEVMEQARG